ncbi:aspartate ammonia-lyase [Aminipila luticellarii]|uniref:Aspartate ammonia-lyase n=1 Tax=Aminipila luticellarii TaxID=2507160 RepID=A0A410PVM9_9FIRM|nr:aspartate ammonia-lyase [Aminipila luticellarii]QAT42968.1 aspartate ammonia-lyase [Aminipila luticellarii]
MDYRFETDSVGEKKVPAEAYYGVQTLRAKENFNITGKKTPEVQIRTLAEIKKACAMANEKAGTLDKTIAEAIIKACDEILNGKFHDQFILDQIQGGAGTSTNMNANEVIANIALEILGKQKGEYQYCHPNDHVNESQSTNDVYPTSIKMSLYRTGLLLAEKLDELYRGLIDKSEEFYDVVKIGRTQLMDAVPITLGQEFHAYASAVERDKIRIQEAIKEMLTINMGATAIGTGINTTEYYAEHIVPTLSEVSGLPLKRCEDMVDGTQNIEGFSVVSSSLKTCAIGLSKMANDIRLMNSGPRAGLGEITIPAKQNGSSIMPGKINPVIPEVLNQCAFGVMGNDFTVTMACEAGQLELNAFEPVVFNRIFDSMTLLINGVDTFIHNCLEGIAANKERCEDLLNHSTGYVTALSPLIGYKKAAKIAKDFLKDGTPIMESALAYGITKSQLEQVLNVNRFTPKFDKK